LEEVVVEEALQLQELRFHCQTNHLVHKKQTWKKADSQIPGQSVVCSADLLKSDLSHSYAATREQQELASWFVESAMTSVWSKRALVEVPNLCWQTDLGLNWKERS